MNVIITKPDHLCWSDYERHSIRHLEMRYFNNYHFYTMIIIWYDMGYHHDISDSYRAL